MLLDQNIFLRNPVIFIIGIAFVHRIFGLGSNLVKFELTSKKISKSLTISNPIIENESSSWKPDDQIMEDELPEFFTPSTREIERLRNIEAFPEGILDEGFLLNAGIVRLYKHENFKGESKLLLVEYNKCLRIPFGWGEINGGIDTLGLCVLIWESGKCDGNHQIIRGDEAQNKDLLAEEQASRSKFIFETHSLELC